MGGIRHSHALRMFDEIKGITFFRPSIGPSEGFVHLVRSEGKEPVLSLGENGVWSHRRGHSIEVQGTIYF